MLRLARVQHGRALTVDAPTDRFGYNAKEPVRPLPSASLIPLLGQQSWRLGQQLSEMANGLRVPTRLDERDDPYRTGQAALRSSLPLRAYSAAARI